MQFFFKKKMNKIVFLLLLQFFKLGLCQKWLTPTGRTIYAIAKKELTITWRIAKEGKSIFYARWISLNDQSLPDQTLAFMNNGRVITTSNNTIISETFDEITFKAIDPTLVKKLKMEIEFLNVGTTFQDTVHVVYVDYPPAITTGLPQATKTYVRNSIASKNVQWSIIAHGKPKPTIVWTLNGRNINTFAEFTVTKQDLGNNVLDLVVRSSVNATQIHVRHIGVLKAVVKYGSVSEQSPSVETSTNIDVHFAPMNITLSTNLSVNHIISSGYINFTCTSYSNPPATYTLMKSSEVISISKKNSFVTYLDGSDSKISIFMCHANNSIGGKYSEPYPIKVFNGTLQLKRVMTDREDWYIYFGVIIAVIAVAFIGIAITLLVIRSRMRSVYIRGQVNRVQLRNFNQKSEYEKKAIRHNGPSHVYNLNQRGTPDGHTKQYNNGNVDLNGSNSNRGFNLYDDPSALPIN